MDRFFFVPKVLEVLSEGRVIRMIVAWALRILAVLTIVWGLFLVVEMLRGAFRMGTEAAVGGLLMTILVIASLTVVVQIFLYRARGIQGLGESPCTVIPIFSVLFRTAGEAYATVLSALGVGGCLFIWLAGTHPAWLLGDLGGLLITTPAEGTFLGGVIFLIAMLIAAFVALLLFYLLAEFVVLLAEIARDVRKLAGNKDSGAPAPAGD